MWIEFFKDSGNESNVVFCRTEADPCFSEYSLSSSWLATSQMPDRGQSADGLWKSRMARCDHQGQKENPKQMHLEAIIDSSDSHTSWLPPLLCSLSHLLHSLVCWKYNLFLKIFAGDIFTVFFYNLFHYLFIKSHSQNCILFLLSKSQNAHFLPFSPW